MKFTKVQQRWVDAIRAHGITGDTITRKNISEIMEADSTLKYPWWISCGLPNVTPDGKVLRGVYINPVTLVDAPMPSSYQDYLELREKNRVARVAKAAPTKKTKPAKKVKDAKKTDKVPAPTKKTKPAKKVKDAKKTDAVPVPTEKVPSPLPGDSTNVVPGPAPETATDV